MSSLDALSDSELRTKLAEYGYPVGPVTQTTRKILVKKLKNLMESRSGGSRFSMAAARYSSDDTDDDSSASAKKKKKTPLSTRRQTLAAPMPPPQTTSVMSPSRSHTKKRLTRNLNSVDSETENNDTPSIVNRSPPKADKSLEKSSKLSKDNDGLETGSDSDIVDEIPSTPSPLVVPKFGGGTTKVYNDRTSTITAADVNSPKPYESSWRRTMRDSYDTSSRTSTTTNALTKDERYTVNLPKPSTSLDSSRNDSLLSKDSSKKDDILSNYDTPYLSEFTRRLSVQSANLSISKPSLLKGTKYRLSSLSGTPDVKETDSNGHFNSPLRSTYPSSSGMTYVTSSFDKTRDINKAYKSAGPQEEVKNNQNFVSMILVGVLALFFGILAIVYLGLEGESNLPLISADSDIPVCTQSFEHNKPGSNCITEELIKDTLYLIKRLHPILMKKAIAVECDYSKDKSYLTDHEIIKMFTNSEMNELKIRELLNMAHFLIIKNPKWGLALLEIPSGNNETPQALKTMDEVFIARIEERIGLFVPEPDLPWQCHMRRQIHTLFTSLLIAAFGALLIIGGQKLVLAYWRHKKNTEKEVFNLVSEIINMLEVHHQNFATASPGGTQESYLAINHIRDNLIPPKDRKKMSGLWEKAVKFLDENESRIRREVQLVAGEEFQVWRWLPNNAASNSPGSSPAPKMSKVWQGSAFETMEGSVNSPSCPPTPCLKIRHMFDADVEFEENWETKVKDAILEKCGDGVKILHIKVDRGSREGCVYIKTMSQEDAGEAYKALHGSWFDGHLVTVKYLRLERYHERFPEAVNFKTPLKPSNNQRLSMQAHYWTNNSEAN